MADSLLNALIARQMGPHDTLSPEVQDQLAREEQATWSPARRKLISGVEDMGSFVKGLGTGGDTTNPSWHPGYAEGVGAMLASLPPLKGAEAIPGLFSKLNRAMESMPSKSKALSMLNQLKKFVTPAELKVRGVEDFLTKKGQAPITLDELREAMKDIQPIDVTKLRGEDTEWSTYKMKGGIPGTYGEDVITQNPVPPVIDKEAIQAARKELVAARHASNQLRLKFGDVCSFRRCPPAKRIILPGGIITKVPEGRSASRILAEARNKAGIRPTINDEFIMQDAMTDAGEKYYDLLNKGKLKYFEPHYLQPNPIATVRHQEMPFTDMTPSSNLPQLAWQRRISGPGQESIRNLENVQSKWHQNYVDPKYAGKIPVAPDPSFADNRWIDLALKQQLLDVANQPHIKGISITPGEEMAKRGEIAGKYINDEVLPKRLGKLLEPFGVKQESQKMRYWPLSDEVKSQMKEKGFSILALLTAMRERSNKEGQ